MDLFKTARGRDSGYTVIIGCGGLGVSLANAISDREASVMMVDRDERAFRKLGSAYGGQTLAGDGHFAGRQGQEGITRFSVTEHAAFTSMLCHILGASAVLSWRLS